MSSDYWNEWFARLEEGIALLFCRPVPETFLARNPTHSCTCWRHGW